MQEPLLYTMEEAAGMLRIRHAPDALGKAMTDPLLTPEEAVYV